MTDEQKTAEVMKLVTEVFAGSGKLPDRKEIPLLVRRAIWLVDEVHNPTPIEELPKRVKKSRKPKKTTVRR